MSITTILAYMAAHGKLLFSLAMVAGIVVYMLPLDKIASSVEAAAGGKPGPPPGPDPEPQQADPFKGCQKQLEKQHFAPFKEGHRCYGYVGT